MSAPRLELRITLNAKRDLADRWNYLAEQSSPATADRFIDAISKTTELLRRAPRVGRVSQVRSRRSVEVRRVAVVRPFQRWVIFYSVEEDVLRLERVLHTAQDLAHLPP